MVITPNFVINANFEFGQNAQLDTLYVGMTQVLLYNKCWSAIARASQEELKVGVSNQVRSWGLWPAAISDRIIMLASMRVLAKLGVVTKFPFGGCDQTWKLNVVIVGGYDQVPKKDNRFYLYNSWFADLHMCIKTYQFVFDRIICPLSI